ncbi:nucleotide disphospho-sugar-binding domain-containing protein [uncultured Aquimarina sp.]|uniref:nucleotide disphospho-sugar-binding domain-containing protein n=1 Tax=uncultured Aquimarina sp. TaxID=575652 RepID=UPI0026028E2B|nr:nucleotide disphospho-sugar-binding domain-containing protein [uncultured Aquimarina sp.]
MSPIKILFACIPADGHFNPMTQLAMHLKEKGHDVRWYTGKTYKDKLKQMGIPYMSFEKAKEIKISELNQAYPERKKLKGISHIKFDIINLFINRMKDYYEDVKKLHQYFPFDILVFDNTFPGTIVKDKLNIPVVGIGVVPLALSAADIPQYGLGHQPATNFLGKRKQNFIKLMAEKLIFRETKEAYNQLLESLNLPSENHNIFDIAPLNSSVFLQNGIPEMDYPRHFTPKSIKYVGALDTWSNSKKKEHKDWKNILNLSKKIILVSQGTVEKNNRKLIIPTLEAFKDSDYIILVTTGYNDTENLRKLYPQKNIHIEDFISYNSVMPLTDIFITNGGYGSCMISLKHGVPMITAGINEGKNEICARIDYCSLGIDLKTERPRAISLQNAVNEILNSEIFYNKVKKVQKELNSYDTLNICEKYIMNLLSPENN